MRSYTHCTPQHKKVLKYLKGPINWKMLFKRNLQIKSSVSLRSLGPQKITGFVFNSFRQKNSVKSEFIKRKPEVPHWSL